MKPAFFVHTFGCRLNQFDGDAMARLLGEAGWSAASTAQSADLQVINSCTITAEAEREAKQFSRRLAVRYPHAAIAWTGCAASTPQAAALRALPNVVAVLDNASKAGLPQAVAALRARREAPEEEGHGADRAASRRDAQPAGCGAETEQVAAAPDEIRPELPVCTDGRRSRPYLKVQDGCDYRCAFCIVPQVRGKSRSLAPATLIAQLDELVDGGAPEVVVTGVHLGTWGRELTPRRTLASLIEELLLHVTGRAAPTRLRLSSIDPHEVDDALVGLFERFPHALCRSLHLPTQSLCDDTLRRMRRAHRAANFVHTVQALLARVPKVAIGTDVIVGFPGESDASFARTEARLAALPLAYLHVFGYSPRPHTAAAAFADAVPAAVRRDRVRRLRALSDAQARAFVERAVGERHRAIVHRTPSRDGRLLAVTDTFIKVHLHGPLALLGRTVDVRIDGALASGAAGTLLSAPATPAERAPDQVLSARRAAIGRARLALLSAGPLARRAGPPAMAAAPAAAP